MAKIALGLARLTLNEKLALGRYIVIEMTGNTNFAKPIPTLVEITAAIDAVEAAQSAAINGGKEATVMLHNKIKTLDDLLTRVGQYVEYTSNGDETKILSAGIRVKAKPTPVGPMPKPNGFKIDSTDRSGELECRIDSITGAKSFVFQVNTLPDNEDSWKNGAISPKPKAVISGLTSGTKYFVRVAAIGAAGQGPWSDVIQRYAV